jgi:hypothetical protein
LRQASDERPDLEPADIDARLGCLRIVSTVPAGLFDLVRAPTARPLRVPRFRLPAPPERGDRIDTVQAAVIPDISRSGMTMGGRLIADLSSEDTARYGFLLESRHRPRRPLQAPRPA